MRIRSILPKFYESEDVGRMDWETRLVFIGLWSYVDDNGVGRDVAALVAADLFPFDLSRDARETLATVSNALETLATGGQIIRYADDDKPLLFVVKWDDYQRVDRPSRQRYLRPTSANTEAPESLATPSRDARTRRRGGGEKGRRGEGEKPPPSPAGADEGEDAEFDEDFAAFWEAYPRKANERTARTAYTSARKKATADVLLAAARGFAKDCRDRETKPQFIVYPAKWLDEERWADQTPLAPQKRSRYATKELLGD